MKKIEERGRGALDIASGLPINLESSSSDKLLHSLPGHTRICAAKGKLTVGSQMFRIRCRQREP